MAHKGALDAPGLTIAVLGCGVDICYPSENWALRNRILSSGCIISEYPPGLPPQQGFFPARNRLISGLSVVTVVVEAAKRSGTLITVGEALEQGREVMAVPGNVTSLLSEGANQLIQEGAGVVTSYEDILRVLGVPERKEQKIQKIRQIDLAPEEELVYDIIKYQPVSLEEIVDKLNLQAQTINYVLTMLELNGGVQKLLGQRYVRL
jgi:DNA processing protein